MPNRVLKDQNYRFGFNGKEADREGQWGSTEHYDYGFRIYDPKLGRFLSVDPLTSSYPWYTPYQFAGNMPIWAIDVDGLEPHTISGDSPDDKIKSSVPESAVPLVTASRTAVVRDNTNIAGLNLTAYPNVQNTRSANPDQYWKFTNGSITNYSSTNEVYQDARSGDGTFANRLLGGEFGEDHAISFMQHDVVAAMGGFNKQFGAILMSITPLGESVGILASRFIHILTPRYTIFYHGTSPSFAEDIIRNGINLKKGNRGADFGQGFYLSKSSTTALSSARRLYGDDAVLLEFKLPNFRLKRLSGLTFNSPSGVWSDFVRFHKIYGPRPLLHGGKHFDFVSGPLVRRISFKTGKVTHHPGLTQFSIHTESAAALFHKHIR